jgi:hypothetical protein
VVFAMPPAYRRLVDLDDLEFGAIGLLFAVSGTVGLVLTLHGMAVGIEAAAAIAFPSMALLLVGRMLDSARPWSLRLAQPACIAAGAIWALAAASVAAAPEVVVYSVALIGACWLAWKFMDRQLHGPDWARGGGGRAVVGAATGGWIEELPDPQLGT